MRNHEKFMSFCKCQWSQSLIYLIFSDWLKVQYTNTKPDLELMKDLNRILFKTLGKTFATEENTPLIVSIMFTYTNMVHVVNAENPNQQDLSLKTGLIFFVKLAQGKII